MLPSAPTVTPAPSLRTEIVAGVTTFFTMAYIVVVNPSILATEGTGMPFSGVLTATVVLAASMTLLMGLYAKLPFAVAPGMGINAFFTFTVILGKGVPWQTALGMVFWAGVVFLLVSATPLREMIVRAIPTSLRHAAGAGIGVFLTFIGLRNAGLVVADPVTFVRFGELGVHSLLAIAGTAIMAVLLLRKSPFAFLAGILIVTLVASFLGDVRVPESLVAAPDFATVTLALDVRGALALTYVPIIVSLLFTDLFDSVSTLIGVSQAGGLLDADGNPKNLRQALVVDALATLGGGLLGTSSGTAFIESSAGIEVGGRTGRTSVVTALCFVPCLFFAPVAGMVPAYATAPVLVLVGAMMFRTVSRLSLERLEDAIPVFLTIALIPLTFSITQGILWGFVSHVGLYVLAGRRREVAPMMYGLAAASVGLLALESMT